MTYSLEHLYQHNGFLTKANSKAVPRYSDTEDPSQIMAYRHIKSFRKAIDVGSKFGVWTRKMGQHFQHVYCFEPKIKWVLVLPKNVRMDNITQYQLGLGAHEGQVSMVGGQIVDPHKETIRPKEIVDVKTLDSFGFSEIDFIKIDTDGYELPVLQGGRETILKWKPTICMEVLPGEPFHGEIAEEYLLSLGAKKIDQEGINFLYSW